MYYIGIFSLTSRVHMTLRAMKGLRAISHPSDDGVQTKGRKNKSERDDPES